MKMHAKGVLCKASDLLCNDASSSSRQSKLSNLKIESNANVQKEDLQTVSLSLQNILFYQFE